MDLTYLLEHSKVPKAFDKALHLLLFLETWPEEKGTERPSLNLALVLDRSGSMEGAKIEATKEAAKQLVRKLHSKDQVAVVAYDSETEVLCPSISASRKEEIFRKIDQIQVKGCTNLSAGWLLGLRLVKEQARPDTLNRVLLLSDGLANEGITKLEDLVDIGKAFLKHGVVTTTLGFGSDFAEDLMSAIAQNSGGRFFFIENEEQVTSVFMQEFGELVRVLGQNLEIRFRPAEGVLFPAAMGTYPFHRKEGALCFSLGDLLEEDQRQLLTAWKVPKDWSPGKHKLCTVEVHYDCVRSVIGPRVHILDVEVEVLEEGEEMPPPRPEVVKEALLYRLSDAKRMALQLEERGDIGGAVEILEKALLMIEESSFAQEPLFQEEKQSLEELVRELQTQRGLDSQSRKGLHFSAYTQTTQLGAYRKRPHVFVETFHLSQENKEKILDLVERYQQVLESFGHPASFVQKAEFILRELAENSLTHGCRQVPKGIVEGEVRISRNYFKVTFKDPGPGFDYSTTLRLQRQSGDTTRTKGLVAIERMGALLQFNEQGNQVSALLSRDRFLLTNHSEPYLTQDGRVGEVHYIVAEGNIDNMTYNRLRAEIQSSLEVTPYLAIDMNKVRYISSSGVGVLLESAERCRAMGGQLFLIHLPDHIGQVLRLLGVESFLVLAADRKEVLDWVIRRENRRGAGS